VFISCRRNKGSDTARLIKDAPKAPKYTTFLDVHDLRSHHLDEELLRENKTARIFVVIVTPGRLNGCDVKMVG
jgi:hypothetical protein